MLYEGGLRYQGPQYVAVWGIANILVLITLTVMPWLLLRKSMRARTGSKEVTVLTFNTVMLFACVLALFPYLGASP